MLAVALSRFSTKYPRFCRNYATKMVLTLQKVLISDEVDNQCVDVLRASGIEVDKNTKLSKDQLIAEIPKYDGLIVRSATKVTADVIDAATNLKIIGRAGTGVDNIDTPAATRKGVIVMNTPGGNTMSAAELTCAMVLAVSRQISEGTASLRAGRWDRKKFMGNEVYGKTLAIIGLGRIGREVASRMQSFGMTTIGYDPLVNAEESAKYNIEWLELEQIWSRADYITVHVPLIPPTRNLINDDVFGKCKEGVRIINVARGGIVDEAALLRALDSGKCAGAGLDVFIEEPPKDLSLVNHPKVVSTPHLGANTTEAQLRVAKEIAEQFVDVVNGKSLFGAINAQALTNALSPSTKPIVALGQSLGSIAQAFLGKIGSQTQIQVITQGSSLKSADSYLKASVLVGLLRSQTTNGLNLVNAPVFGKELGIQIASKSEAAEVEGFPHLVTVVAQETGGAIYRVSGYAAGNSAFVSEICGAKFTPGAILYGSNLLYKSQANPQVMPAVAGALGGANITVQSYAGSSPADGETWNLMQVSAPVENLDIIKLHVNQAFQVNL